MNTKIVNDYICRVKLLLWISHLMFFSSHKPPKTKPRKGGSTVVSLHQYHVRESSDVPSRLFWNILDSFLCECWNNRITKMCPSCISVFILKGILTVIESLLWTKYRIEYECLVRILDASNINEPFNPMLRHIYGSQ